MNLNSNDIEKLTSEETNETSDLIQSNRFETLERKALSKGHLKNKPMEGRRASCSVRTSRRPLLEHNQFLLAVNDTRSELSQNASICILLIINCCERFAYYGIICNYILYFNKLPLDWTSYNATTMLLIFQGVTFTSSLIGGWFADSLIGKYSAICISYIVYIIGYTIFPFISWYETEIPSICGTSSGQNMSHLTKLPIKHPMRFYYLNENIGDAGKFLFQENCSEVIFIFMIATGAAIGVLKANLAPFGANQVYSRGQSMVFKYFNWLYWSINLGSLLAFFVLAFIQQNISFFVGYLIPIVALLFSFLLFLSGSGCYIKTGVQPSVLTNIFKVILEAYKSVKRQKNLVRQTLRERALLSEEDKSEASEEEFIYESYYNTSSNSLSGSLSKKNISWLDNAKIRYGGRYDVELVDDVKSLKKIIILFALMIPYWIVYVQMESMFVVQGLHTKILSKRINEIFGFKHIVLPIAWLSLVDSLTILILIPFLDTFVYPRCKLKNKFKGGTRMVLGMSFSALAVILAGLFETYRLEYILEDPEKNSIAQLISNTTYIAANLTIAWQIPQYILVGLGEVFCGVSAVYYAYSIAPKSMESIIMGLFYFFSGIGSLIGSVLLVSLKSVIYNKNQQDDLNCPNCRLNYYFYLLGILQIFGILGFIWANSKYSLTTERAINDNEICESDVEALLSPNLSGTTTTPDTSISERINETGSPVNI